MRTFLTTLRNKCTQYSHRIFYTCMSNGLILWYNSLFEAVINLGDYMETKTSKYPNTITLVSEKVVFKTIVFIYCFITGTRLIMISPKFSPIEIISAMLSRRNLNVLFIDSTILLKLNHVAEEEHINFKQFFNCIETTSNVWERLQIIVQDDANIKFRRLFMKGRASSLLNDEVGMSVLSPGTTSEPCITNVSYSIIGDSMRNLIFFMGLKPSDKVSVIADFEYFPGLYTILGLLSGVHYVMPATDGELSSAEELKDSLAFSNHKPNVVFITSNNFKKVWDSIILKVYSNKYFFFMSKITLLSWIVDRIVLRELSLTFGKSIKKVHILNEELGFTVLDILKKSKIMFTSSYGFIEQGNFLAFKDPEVFKHKNFIYKPGGTLLKNNNVFIESDGEIYLKYGNRKINSEDMGIFIKNIPNQGDRQYLQVLGRIIRATGDNTPHLDLVEKSFKDTMLVRNCYLRANNTPGKETYTLCIEPRKDLLDIKHIGWDELNAAINLLALDIKKNVMLDVTNYTILGFDGMCNIVGKIQYYTL